MKSLKLFAIVLILAIIIMGVNIGGPKFVNALQMHFGMKGKIDRLEQCIDMPGCSIGPDDLEFYQKYLVVKASEAVEKLMESEAVEALLEE